MADEETQEQDQSTELLQFEELIQGLIDNEYGCCNDFILPGTVNGLNATIRNLSESESMKPSGFGNNEDFKKDELVRGDKINWIEEESTNPFELIYLNKIGKFIGYLNRTCFTAITSFESHYSSYEKNSFYKRHIDQFKNEKGNIRSFFTSMKIGKKRMADCSHSIQKQDSRLISLPWVEEWSCSAVMKWNTRSILL